MSELDEAGSYLSSNTIGEEMSELTGEELTEKFFTEVKGWKCKNMNDPALTGEKFFLWSDRQGVIWAESTCETGQIIPKDLPPLHTSLDLQKEWLWPELLKKLILIQDCDYHYEEKMFYVRYLGRHEAFRSHAPTKALAQLEAVLKALGII